MYSLPVLFSFRDLIEGKDFTAGVVVNGRALLVEEGDGDVWLYGVHPGAMAGGGKGRDAAVQEFRNGFRSVLIDLAGEADSFEAFRQEVVQFFEATDAETEAEWDTACARLLARPPPPFRHPRIA